MQKRSQVLVVLGWVSLCCVYLVISAGATVRATGSGMGCPDWPQCYGYTIPPTHRDQVTWSEQRKFFAGQMIIHDWTDEAGTRERLLVARETFITGDQFVPDHWSVYGKHDYTIFNPVHTWIEFINRMLGALSGVPVLCLFFVSVVGAVKNRAFLPAVYASATLFGLGFVAWLGKLVVDGNLIPGSITYHMFGSIGIVGALILGIRHNQEKVSIQPYLRWLIGFTLLCVLAQVYIGTQVREEVDYIVKAGNEDRSTWVGELSAWFIVHRSFSWFILALVGLWIFRLWQTGHRFVDMWLVAVILLIQTGVGVVLNYADMPALAQPIHLVLAIVLVGVLWNTWLKTKGLNHVANGLGPIAVDDKAASHA